MNSTTFKHISTLNLWIKSYISKPSFSLVNMSNKFKKTIKKNTLLPAMDSYLKSIQYKASRLEIQKVKPTKL